MEAIFAVHTSTGGARERGRRIELCPDLLNFATASTRRRTLDVVYMQTTGLRAYFDVSAVGLVNIVLVTTYYHNPPKNKITKPVTHPQILAERKRAKDFKLCIGSRASRITVASTASVRTKSRPLKELAPIGALMDHWLHHHRGLPELCAPEEEKAMHTFLGSWLAHQVRVTCGANGSELRHN